MMLLRASCLVLCFLILSCLALPCLVLPCLALPCLALPRRLAYTCCILMKYDREDKTKRYKTGQSSLAWLLLCSCVVLFFGTYDPMYIYVWPSLEKVAKHNTESDCWVVLGEPGSRKVYRIEKYLPDHPGGPEIVLDVAGADAHQEFEVHFRMSLSLSLFLLSSFLLPPSSFITL